MESRAILVVDDQPAVAKALVALVRACGYEASAVHGGAQALESVHASPPHLILLDLNMPGTSGFDVLRELRAAPELQAIPVIVCTAAPVREICHEALDLGAREVIGKQDAFEELPAALARQLEGNPVEGKPAGTGSRAG
jgi:CheY-like chemotaxis protein